MDTESLKEKLQEAKDNLQEKAQEAVETVKEVASETAEKAQEVASDAKEVAGKVVEEVKDAAGDAVDNAQDVAQAAVEDVKEVAQGVADEAKTGIDELKETVQGVTTDRPAEPKPEKHGPSKQLPTGRGLIKFILLGIITLGIYQLVMLTKISSEVNTVCKPHDNKSTMNFCLLFFIVAPLTLGIGWFVWWHRICNRMGNELARRKLPYSISASTFWGWYILGSLISIGPFVFFYQFLKAQNILNSDYNMKG